MGKYININNLFIGGEKWRIQRLLQEKGYFEKEYFVKLNARCLDRVRHTIESNKEALLNIADKLNISRYGRGGHALRLMIYNDADVSTFVSRLQVHGKNLYASYIKEEIGQAINDDYMKMPEYVRSAIPKERMVSEIVRNFLHENEKNIRKAVSNMVYENLRKLIDKELF